MQIYYDFIDFNTSLYDEKLSQFGSTTIAKNYIKNISIPEYIREIAQRFSVSAGSLGEALNHVKGGELGVNELDKISFEELWEDIQNTEAEVIATFEVRDGQMVTRWLNNSLKIVGSEIIVSK